MKSEDIIGTIIFSVLGSSALYTFCHFVGLI